MQRLLCALCVAAAFAALVFTIYRGIA